MFCGFGAVVLLVLIVNSHMVEGRREKHKDLHAVLSSLEQEVRAEENLRAELRNSMKQAETEVRELNGRSEILLHRTRQTEEEISRYRNRTLAEQESIKKLQTDLKHMDSQHRRQIASLKADTAHGTHAVRFAGQGNRQYLTGLRLGGRRVLILIDSSASMLDSTVVGIIRKRNMSASVRSQAHKWRQAVKTVRWLMANLPLDASVKLMIFNERVKPMGDAGKHWIPVRDSGALSRMLSALEKIVPERGTSLWRAFAQAASIDPPPDNIMLLTDGLPTIGAARPEGSTITSLQRVRLFEKAAARLPHSVPVNTILFPLEGDPMAAALFWKLAVDTSGSFLTPSSDWP